MKLHFFLPHRRTTVKPLPLTFQVQERKTQLSVTQECGTGSRDDSTSHRCIATKVEQLKRLFLFRIIPRFKNHKHFQSRKQVKNGPSPTPGSHVSSTPTTATSSTKKNGNDRARQHENDMIAPMSIIRINTANSMDELSQRELLFTKLTSTKLMTEHGLERNDSIISYFKDMDEAYHQMVIVVDHNDATAPDKPLRNNNDDDDDNYDYDYDDDEFYRNTIEQSISQITMDPAIVYRHSISINEYSFQNSFQSISDGDYEEDTYGEGEEEKEERIAPIRYCQI